MCSNCGTLLDVISRIVQNLYPKLQHQLILLEMEFADYTIHDHSYPNSEISVVEALCNEITSLISYDKKLVLPSILKFLEKRWPLDKLQSPNISELLKLTQLKEERIFHLMDNLSGKLDFLNSHPQLKNLLVILEDDFFPLKEQYNKSVLNTLRLRDCVPERCLEAELNQESRNNHERQ